MKQTKFQGNKLFPVLVLVLFHCNSLKAQFSFPDPGPVFTDTVVPRIDIIMNPADLSSLYANPLMNTEYPCTFIFDNRHSSDTLYNTGIRIRGNTSRYSAKKSFKLSFNTYVHGRKFNHLEKLNLNGEHNDPSIIRSKLGWDFLKKMGIPASRANHVELYINGVYYGLYINVEDIDENFVKSRFGNNDGNLYKCIYPADLSFLSHDPDSYKQPMNGSSRAYELQINDSIDDYSDLSHFIDILNNTPSEDLPTELEKVFDVNSFLKIIVFDILTGNWDDYIYNKNNFFLYHNSETGQFEFIPYDLDNTFGIDWFGIDWANRDIDAWGPADTRPLFYYILQYEDYAKRFAYYMNLALTKYFNPSKMNSIIDAKKNLIYIFAFNDLYRTYDYGWSFNDFINSYTQPLSGHVKSGLKPFILARSESATSQLDLLNISPIISWVNTNKAVLFLPFIINASIEDDDSLPQVALHYSINDGAEQTLDMYDDGAHQDLLAADHIFGAELSWFSEPAKILYYIEAVDKNSNISREPLTGWYLYNISSFIDGLVKNDKTPIELKAFPNPFNHFLNITIPPGFAHKLTMHIFNSTGQLVYSKPIQNGSSIVHWDGNDSGGNSLPAGLYLVSIKYTCENSTQILSTGKIMKLN